MHQDQVGRWFNIKKSINVTSHQQTKKEKSHDHINGSRKSI